MKFIITLMVMVLSFFSAQASSDSLFDFAEYLFQEAQYDRARLEFKRCRFNGTADSALCTYFIGKTFLKQNDSRKATGVFETIIDNKNNSPELRLNAHLDLIKSCIAREEYNLARYEIDQVHKYAVSESAADEIRFLTLLTEASLFRTDSIMKLAERLNHTGQFYSTGQQISELAAGIDAAHYKSPRKAYLLSSLVPGSGQLYCGNKKDAAGAFLLVSALTSGMVWSGSRIINGTPHQRTVAKLDIAFLGLFVWFRYYDGSRKTAFEMALRHNRSLQHQYQKKLAELKGF
jgi:hypothetical protein